ncbi:MAG: methionyl-tRNA formyltransferase [Candidatus Paceibacterota bacterium]
MNTSFVFFGSYRFAYIVLSDLLSSGFIPSAIVCSSDKLIGRKQILTPPPVKELALQYRIPLLQPVKKPHPSDIESLGIDASFAIVAAYAQLIPIETLALFPRGVIGVHPSLLPLYRGASPIQTALLNRIPTTGISLYKMDAEMDHGPLLVQEDVPIHQQDTYLSLEGTLAHRGALLLTRTIPLWLDDALVLKEQDHTCATYTQKFVTEDGKVNLQDDIPDSIARKIRALSHDPGVFTFINNKRVKLLEVKDIPEGYMITKIIPEGRKEQEARIILRK